MKLYRCLICGDPYMGNEKPTNCPFCGAPEEYLVTGREWVDENLGITELTEVSRGNLVRALQLEVNNSAFYRDAMNRTKNIELQGIFKYLSKVEAEHASTIRKIIKGELPPPEPGKEAATDDDHKNLELAMERESNAKKFYEESGQAAIEPRVKRVFEAISRIENDHVGIEKGLLSLGN